MPHVAASVFATSLPSGAYLLRDETPDRLDIALIALCSLLLLAHLFLGLWQLRLFRELNRYRVTAGQSPLAFGSRWPDENPATPTIQRLRQQLQRVSIVMYLNLGCFILALFYLVALRSTS